MADRIVRLRGHIELERVNELVADHMVRIRNRTGKGQNDPPSGCLCDSTDTFPELALNDVGLLEIGVRGVEDQRLATAKLMVEDPGQARVPPFGQPRAHVDSRSAG